MQVENAAETRKYSMFMSTLTAQIIMAWLSISTTNAKEIAGSIDAMSVHTPTPNLTQVSMIMAMIGMIISKNEVIEEDKMREYVVENEFVKAVRSAGGIAYKLTSQTANGLPDRLVLFFPAKTVFVELKAPGKMMRPLQRKRRYQLMKLGFLVLCIDRVVMLTRLLVVITLRMPTQAAVFSL